ncbi:uncharacterized protein LOC107425276 [Ziziphus jujuba]|uniref:Uncharacterized protein LOC107425276 n=1 Tax=Ziziphus jujuba TaxID=326968 RepID=A0A6P4AP93_ZIZJJ|nr:uncharacterized protein LOC107425276 [Ziziphus jujuba]
MFALSCHLNNSQIVHYFNGGRSLLAHRRCYIKPPCFFKNMKITITFTDNESDNSQEPVEDFRKPNEEPPDEPPAKPQESSSVWRNWTLGILLSILLPSFRHKWGPYLLLKSQVDMAVETAETVAEVVEDIAEVVEKVADEVADRLPENGKVKDAVESIEHFAEEVAEDAKIAQEFIHKVEEVEEKIESLNLFDMDRKSDRPKES